MLVEWTKPAIQDLDDIENFIAADNYERAISFVDELISLGDSLEDDSTCQKGAPVKWIEDENIRELFYKGYAIIYEICDNRVIIHEVYNQSKIMLHFGKR